MTEIRRLPTLDQVHYQAKLDHADEADQHWNLGYIVSDLRSARLEWRKRMGRNGHGSRILPSRDVLRDLSQRLCGILFPMRLGPQDLRDESADYYVGHSLGEVLGALEGQILLELRSGSAGGSHGSKAAGAAGAASQPGPAFASGAEREVETLIRNARLKTRQFGESLPRLRRLLDTDVEAAYTGDPAARSVDEILLCYPGVRAVVLYRLAHRLHQLDLPLIARIISEVAHAETGIDIHPGAVIGKSFFIDHGTGVVIGETAVIGERVRLYQAVTLGAKSFPKAEDGSLRKGLRRHPTVEDDVVIYAGATVLGRITIGRGAVIGGNVWLTQSVAPGGVITQAGVNQELLVDGSGI
jgi:serine O-acetyltransferase